MKHEEKLLLLKDLSARIEHGVQVHYKGVLGERSTPMPIFDYNGVTVNSHYEVEGIRAYLRPMSSMTVEEHFELKELDIFGDDIEYRTKGVIEVSGYVGRLTVEELTAFFDWLLEHHFDFRGLIKKGLALEAPEGMY